MRTRSFARVSALLLTATLVLGAAPASAQVQTPEAFFGFTIGADGELARYPKVLEYFQHLAKQTDRVRYEEIGKTTMGNSFALVTISSPANLKRFDRLVAINRRLADPRGLSDAEAATLAAEGRPFYLLYATIHSTEVGNGQTILLLGHKLATENSPAVREMLDNAVLLLVPSQNPDGQHLVVDHWYKTKGTNFNRVYPDLYHKYAGHDDNRDWFMFTQKETRMMVERVQNHFKPVITHDMHQQGSTGSRIFVPPFMDPFDPQHSPDPRPGAGDGRPGDGHGAHCRRQGRDRVGRRVRPVGAGAAVHAVSRATAHPHRDRFGESCRPVREPRGQGPAARTAGGASEFPETVYEGRVAPLANRRLRAHRRARRHFARREVPHRVPDELLQGAQGLGELERRAVRLRRPRRAARSAGHIRAARRAAHRRRRDRAGRGAVHGGRQTLRRGILGDPRRAALRRVRQDDARAADLSGSAAVSRRSAEGAVRRHRPHAGVSARRRRRSDRDRVRRAADAGERSEAAPVAAAGRAALGLCDRPRIERGVHRRRAAAGGERPGVQDR